MGLDILRAIQSYSHPVLDILFQLVTMCGEEILLAGFFCCIYWCVDKRVGKFLVYTLSFSLCLNGVVKDIFRIQRPIGQAGIVSQRVDTATGYSFPSNHSQSAAAFWWGGARWTGKRRFLVAASIVVLAVGFSRLYLGVHYLSDVLGGIIFGLLGAEILYHLAQKSSSSRMIPVLCVIMAFAALFFGISEDTIVSGALALGVLVGGLFEGIFVDFKISGSVGHRVCRFLFGAVLVGICYLLPSLLIANELVANTLSVALVALMAVGVYPWIFTRLHL